MSSSQEEPMRLGPQVMFKKGLATGKDVAQTSQTRQYQNQQVWVFECHFCSFPYFYSCLVLLFIYFVYLNTSITLNIIYFIFFIGVYLCLF